MKHCNKCNTDKPLEAFSLDKRNDDGRNYVCKECFKNYYDADAKSKKAYQKQQRLYKEKKRLEKAPPPDVDKALHTTSVKMAEELDKITSHLDLGANEVGRVKAIIDILLTIRKNARPKKPKEEKSPSKQMDDLFEDEK